MSLLGAHMSVAGGLEKSIARGESIGCETIQIFSKNQRQWRSPELKDEDIERFRNSLAQSAIEQVVIHDSYLINLAQPDPEKRQTSIDAFIDEMIRADRLEVPYLVFHPGSALENPVDEGLGIVASSINKIFADQETGRVTLLLENTAGQGSNLGCTFEQISAILNGVENKERMGVCLDTAHAYASGYDLSTPAGYEELFSSFDREIGLDKLAVFHLNDSKTDRASRVDRHENIGDGMIGSEFFKELVNDPRFRQCPMILETPGGDEMFRKNLDFLKSVRKSEAL